MSELQPLNARVGEVRCVFPFVIQPDWLPAITYRGDPPTPRYELQLRMFAYDPDIEQADDFPPSCTVRINDQLVMLPVSLPIFGRNA